MILCPAHVDRIERAHEQVVSKKEELWFASLGFSLRIPVDISQKRIPK